MATIGVKVELEGAQAYKQGMAQCTNETKLYQAEAKKLQNELKNGNGNWQTRIQLSKTLQNQLASQKKQEELLTAEIQRVSATEGENSDKVIKLKTQYENLQRAIANTEQALKDNGGQLSSVGAYFEELGGKVEAVGKKISSFGEGMAKNVTAPIMAVGAASLVAFNEVDNAMDIIITKTGATGEALQEMQDIASNIATTIPTSFETAGNAVGEVNTRFGVTGQELEDLSTKFIQFAQINGTEVSSSIDTVQSAMAAFGLDVSQTGVFLDTLNKAGQDTGISVDTLAQSMTTNAAALKEMGYSASDSAMFIANLSKQGIDAGTVMAGMKKAFTNATAEGKTMEQAMAELQTTMQNASTDTEAYQQAIELFGSKAGVSIAEACQSGRLSFEELGTSMEDFSGNVENTFNATLDPVDEFQMHLNEIKLLGTDVANSMMPMITKAMESLGKAIQSAVSFWNSLSESQQQFIVQVAGVVAAVGPVLIIVGKIVSGVGMLITNIGTIVTFVSGTLIPVITGTLIPAITTVGTVITTAVIPAIVGVVTACAPFLAIGAAIAAVIGGIVLVVKNWGAITEWASGVWSAFSDFIGGVVEGIGNFFSNTFTAIGETTTTAFTNVSSFIGSTMSSVGSAVSSKLSEMKTGFSNAFTLIKSGASEFYNNMTTTTVEKMTAISNSLKTRLTNIKNNFSTTFSNITTTVGNAWTSIKSSFADGVSNAVAKTSEMATNVGNGIKTMSSNAISEVASMASNITGKFSDLVSNSLSWGRDMIGNFASGIKEKMSSLLDEVKSMASEITSYLHFTVPDKGPLAKADTWMPDFMELLATGIDNNKYLVTKAAQGLALDMSAIMAEPFSYDDMYSAVRDGASSATTRIILNDREVTRALTNMGVAFNG